MKAASDGHSCFQGNPRAMRIFSQDPDILVEWELNGRTSVCRYGVHCSRATCPFEHPNGREFDRAGGGQAPMLLDLFDAPPPMLQPSLIAPSAGPETNPLRGLYSHVPVQSGPSNLPLFGSAPVASPPPLSLNDVNAMISKLVPAVRSDPQALAQLLQLFPNLNLASLNILPDAPQAPMLNSIPIPDPTGLTPAPPPPPPTPQSVAPAFLVPSSSSLDVFKEQLAMTLAQSEKPVKDAKKAGGDTISEAQRDKEREKELAQERKKADIKETKKEAEESYMSLLEYCRSVGMSQWEAADFLESGRVKETFMVAPKKSKIELDGYQKREKRTRSPSSSRSSSPERKKPRSEPPSPLLPPTLIQVPTLTLFPTPMSFEPQAPRSEAIELTQGAPQVFPSISPVPNSLASATPLHSPAVKVEAGEKNSNEPSKNQNWWDNSEVAAVKKSVDNSAPSVSLASGRGIPKSGTEGGAMPPSSKTIIPTPVQSSPAPSSNLGSEKLIKILSKYLFVGNLAPEVTQPALASMFGPYGEIVSLKILQGNTSWRYSFIQFKTRESAEKAKQELQGRDLLGRPVKIGWKNPLSMEPSVTFNSEEGFVLVAPSVAARHGIKLKKRDSTGGVDDDAPTFFGQPQQMGPQFNSNSLPPGVPPGLGVGPAADPNLLLLQAMGVAGNGPSNPANPMALLAGVDPILLAQLGLSTPPLAPPAIGFPGLSGALPLVGTSPAGDLSAQLIALGLPPQMLASLGPNISGTGTLPVAPPPSLPTPLASALPNPANSPFQQTPTPSPNPLASLGLAPQVVDPAILQAIGSAALLNPAVLATLGGFGAQLQPPVPKPEPPKSGENDSTDVATVLLAALLGGDSKPAASSPGPADLKKQLVAALLEKKKDKEGTEKKSNSSTDLLKNLLLNKLAEIGAQAAQESGFGTNLTKGEGNQYRGNAEKQRPPHPMAPLHPPPYQQGGQGGVQPKPGDWQCALCGQNNFAKRSACFSCNSIRGAQPAQGQGGQQFKGFPGKAKHAAPPAAAPKLIISEHYKKPEPSPLSHVIAMGVPTTTAPESSPVATRRPIVQMPSTNSTSFPMPSSHPPQQHQPPQTQQAQTQQAPTKTVISSPFFPYQVHSIPQPSSQHLPPAPPQPTAAHQPPALAAPRVVGPQQPSVSPNNPYAKQPTQPPPPPSNLLPSLPSSQSKKPAPPPPFSGAPGSLPPQPPPPPPPPPHPAPLQHSYGSYQNPYGPFMHQPAQFGPAPYPAGAVPYPGHHAAHGGSAPSVPQGQQDYSQQWAQYYASMGLDQYGRPMYPSGPGAAPF